MKKSDNSSDFKGDCMRDFQGIQWGKKDMKFISVKFLRRIRHDKR